METWRLIPGYEGRNPVSDQGRVMSHQSRANPGRLLVRHWDDGAFRFLAYREGIHATLYVHDAVMAALVGPTPEGTVVRFRDGDQRNARLANLSYSYRYDPMPMDVLPASTTPVHTLTAELARAIAARPDRASDAAQRFGGTIGIVTSIRIGRIWRDATEGCRLPSYWKRTNAKLSEEDVGYPRVPR